METYCLKSLNLLAINMYFYSVKIENYEAKKANKVKFSKLFSSLTYVDKNNSWPLGQGLRPKGGFILTI